MFPAKTLFSKNVGGTVASADAKYKTMVDMYSKLSVYVQTVRILLAEYSAGHLVELSHVLTMDAYNKMALDLNMLAADANKYKDYENMRKGIADSLSGIYRGVLQNNILLDTEAQLSLANDNLQTLYDPVKLQEYIDVLRQKHTMFVDSNVQMEARATMNPEYIEYIRLYGYPDGGIFDMDKLAAILVRVN